jgi:hypothetical protein
MSTPKLDTRTPSSSKGARRSTVTFLLAGLETFVGLSAVYGGTAMLRDPLHPMGVTTDLIAGSPFTTYTWPGVLLLILVGIAPLLLAIGVVTRVRGAVALSAAFGVGLVAWICVQWALLLDRLWLQPVMFAIGIVIVALSPVLYRRGAW